MIRSLPVFRERVYGDMKIHINGEERVFAGPAPPADFTLTSLIEAMGMKSDRVAVELNRAIIPRDRWPQTLLQEGDQLEIVHFVGGGCPPHVSPVIPSAARDLGFEPR